MRMNSGTSFLSEKPVLVAGASGFVGSHIVRLLVSHGRKVRILVRKSSKLDALRNMPVEIHYGDVLDSVSLRKAMEGCGTVFYCVVAPRFWVTDVAAIYRNNVEGLLRAMEVALECRTERFIFTSTMGTLGLNPNGPVTEDIEFNWYDRAPAYIRARLAAEKMFLIYCREQHLPGIALCVANAYGPDDYQPTPQNEMLWKVANGEIRFVLDASSPTVDIRDVADAALLAEKYGAVGERYIIANEFISNKEFYAMATSQRGKKAPRLISRRLAYSLAWTVERIFRIIGKKDSIFSTDAVYLSNVFREMDNSKARQELLWSPRPLAETIKDATAWFAGRDNCH